MTETVLEKDRVVSHLQNTNMELEEYVANLEKLSTNFEYKGKPLASSQNKGRTLKKNSQKGRNYSLVQHIFLD